MKKVILALCALLFLNAGFWHTSVLADTDDLVLSIGVKEEYLDNIFFNPDDKVDDFITTLSPGIEVRKRSERLNAGFLVLLDAVIYIDNNDLNNLDQYYEGYAKYLLSERLSVEGTASYKDDSRPDRDVSETGLLLGIDVRKTQRYNGEIEYELSELSDVSFGYIYRKEDFDDVKRDDYDSHSAVGLWKYNLGSWMDGTWGNVKVNYSHYNYRFSQTDNYSATLGIEKELSELYKFYLDIGGRYSKYKFFEEEDLNINDDGAGGVLKTGVKYNGEYTNTNLYILHDIAPASGRGRTLERTSFIGNYRYRLTEKITGVLRGGYYWNRGDVSFDPFDEKTIRISPQLIYSITNNLRVRASYSYTNINSKKIDDDRDRNDVFIRLAFNHTLFD